jgi:hypothetical protein
MPTSKVSHQPMLTGRQFGHRERLAHLGHPLLPLLVADQGDALDRGAVHGDELRVVPQRVHGLECLPGRLVGQPVRGEVAQVAVDQLEELGGGIRVAGPHRVQKRSEVGHWAISAKCPAGSSPFREWVRPIGECRPRNWPALWPCAGAAMTPHAGRQTRRPAREKSRAGLSSNCRVTSPSGERPRPRAFRECSAEHIRPAADVNDAPARMRCCARGMI